MNSETYGTLSRKRDPTAPHTLKMYFAHSRQNYQRITLLVSYIKLLNLK